MSYKMDGESIAPEVFTFAGPAVPQRKTKPLKNKKNAAGQSAASGPPQPSPQSSQPAQNPQPPIASTIPPASEPNFWEKPPAFCDISIKDALAPIKRNGVEVESPFTADQVLRAAAAEIEHYSTDGLGAGRGVENYGWYLGKEEHDRKRKAAERAKYAGKAKGKGKVQGKLVNLSQLRAVASGMSSTPAAAPSRSAVAANSNDGGRPVRGYIARPSQKFVPIDSGSDTGSEYHDADCECGCVSASDIEEEQAAMMANGAVQTSGKRPRAPCSDSDGYISKPSSKGKEVARGPQSDTPSMPPTSRESEDEYYGSDCGCEGEYCDSDCNFYPSDFYASDVYFEVERPATPEEATRAAAPSVTSSSPISYASTPSGSSSSSKDFEDDIPNRRRGPPQRRALPSADVAYEFEYIGLDTHNRITDAAVSRASRQQGQGRKHSPPAKRRRPTTSSRSPRPHRNQNRADPNVLTLGQLALNAGTRNPPNSFDRVPLPTRRQHVEPVNPSSSAQESDSDRARRERMVEMERQRLFLQTLVADLPRMQQETAAIVAASFTSAPPNPYLPSPPDTPTPPFPGSAYADSNVLVVRRPSIPSDFEFEEEVSEYDSETDPWTFIQHATARDLVRVERAGAEPSIDMLARLQKSSRREAFGVWREKLRSRQAARATAPPQRTSLPSRPRTGPSANASSGKIETQSPAGTNVASAPRRRPEATGTPQERATAMKLQLEAVLGTPRPAPHAGNSSSASAKIQSAISLSLQVEAELEAAAEQPTDKRTLEALASRHSAALSAMAASYSAQEAEIEEQAFAEVRELALAARASGSFRPLTRNPVLRQGRTASAVIERGNGTRGAGEASMSEHDVQRQAAAREWRHQVASIEAQAFAEVRELALARREREAGRAGHTTSLPPFPSSTFNVLLPSFKPPAQFPRHHPDSTPFMTMTPDGPRDLGFRTPEYLWEIGWRGWTNLTREEQEEEERRRRRRAARWWIGREGQKIGRRCPLQRYLSCRDVRSRTSFVCLLCREPHLASF